MIFHRPLGFPHQVTTLCFPSIPRRARTAAARHQQGDEECGGCALRLPRPRRAVRHRPRAPISGRTPMFGPDFDPFAVRSQADPAHRAGVARAACGPAPPRAHQMDGLCRPADARSCSARAGDEASVLVGQEERQPRSILPTAKTSACCRAAQLCGGRPRHPILIGRPHVIDVRLSARLGSTG